MLNIITEGIEEHNKKYILIPSTEISLLDNFSNDLIKSANENWNKMKLNRNKVSIDLLKERNKGLTIRE